MNTANLSTERLRHLLEDIETRGLPVTVRPSRDIPGPGGGVYITSQTSVNAKHLDWLESRNPLKGSPTYLEVTFQRGGEEDDGVAAPLPGVDLPVPADEGRDEVVAREDRARRASARVAAAAREVADQSDRLVRLVSRPEVTGRERRRADTDAGLREFERAFGDFHGAVKHALDEYLRGNTLVMDLIVHFELDRATVRHGLAVAAFATEMAAQLALRDDGEDEDLSAYFGDVDAAEVRRLLGEEDNEGEEDELQARRRLFQRELVEIFLGGFMHDCGLWMDPFYLEEGHEVKGTKLIASTREVRGYAPALARIVLFHSEVARLARKRGVVEVVEYPDDPERCFYRAEFYDTEEDAVASVEMRAGHARASLLSSADLRKVLPVALAEHFISQTQDVYTKPPEEVIADLVQHIRGGIFPKYMAVLCNSRVEVVAPRRALVTLKGHLSVIVEGRRNSRRAERLDMDGYDAGSLFHGGDRNSPHLITLFLRRRDGSRARTEYLSPQDPTLWGRSAGLDSRMYIPAGRFRNNLTYRVTGFMSEELYERILAEYEQEFERRR